MKRANTDKLYDDEYYVSKEYGFYNNVRADHDRLLELIKFKKSDRVLDVGCGYGVLLSKIPVKNKYKVGIETNEKALNECKRRGIEAYLEKNIESKTRFNSNSFDVILMNEVIEHLKNPEGAIKECYRLLKVGGILGLTTPNRSRFFSAPDPTHFSVMDYRELDHLVKENRFEALHHEVNGWAPLLPLMEWLIFKPGRFVKNWLSGFQKDGAVDQIHKGLDLSMLRPTQLYRSWGMSLGTGQLLVARKV